jgi:hypothetical protein
MLVVKGLLILALLTNDAGTPPLEAAPFLRPYVAQLKNDLPATERSKLAAFADEDLIQLHDGYGMGIRNRWLCDDRDKQLFAFFDTNGIHHPDDMSMVLIRALWLDLRAKLTPEQRQKNEKENDVRRRKRANYERLMSECDSLFKKHGGLITSCFERLGPNSAPPALRSPFSKLTVLANGRVRRIEPFIGGSNAANECLQRVLTRFSFSSFDLDPYLTLYTLDEGSCRVQELDNLHP